MTNGSMETLVPRPAETVDQPSLSARAYEPHTRSLFLEAGLEPGMRVLDAWSAGGDVAFLASEIVGPYGQVIGFDHSSAPVAYASARAAARGLTNVRFVEAEVAALPFAAEFDAIVGRIALIYRLNPVADLKELIRYL